jgi:NADH dehydrogenase
MTVHLRDLQPAAADRMSLTSSHDEAGSAARPPRVVIVGAGFGGLAAATALRGAPVEVTVIDRHNYHLFQPLLYQVATAALSPADIAQPIRAILGQQRNVEVLLGKVDAIDTAAREVRFGERRIRYDMLVVATGARHAYFGHDEWEPYAPGLKKIDDATDIRRRILLAFERAEAATDPERRARLLTFVVVGGGPTGVELAGAIAELARHTIRADFRHIDPREARVLLVEGGPRLLPALPERLSAFAAHALEGLGVEVRLDTMVTGCDAAGVDMGAERLDAGTVLWAAGVAASPAARWLGADKDRAGRVKVGADLTLPGHPEIFVAGDAAQVDGGKVPGVAPAAMQAGRHIATSIRRRRAGRPTTAFRYRDKGTLATIGRARAVADLPHLRFSGFPAWLAWMAIHIWFLIGVRNRAFVFASWAWSYLTFRRGARIITGLPTSDRGDTSGPDR